MKQVANEMRRGRRSFRGHESFSGDNPGRDGKMKPRQTGKIMAVSSLVFAGLLWLSPPAMAEDPVDFPDATLKAAVESALGVSDPTPTDMLSLTDLRANRSGIADITGLEFATNLTHLELLRNRIIDISPRYSPSMRQSTVPGFTSLRVQKSLTGMGASGVPTLKRMAYGWPSGTCPPCSCMGAAK